MARTHNTTTRRQVHKLDRVYRELGNTGNLGAANQIRNEVAALGGGQYRPRYGNHRKMMAEQKLRLRRSDRRQRNDQPLELE